jgi:hypothetical protein
MSLILAEFCGRWGCTWQQRKRNLTTARFVGRTLRNIAKN